MKMLQQLAADTPSSLQEWTEAYIKLVNRGVKPTSQELVNMGDLAASQGKSVDQLIEAILDAMTGENERLKEFGIKASKSGETTKFSFRGVTTEVRNLRMPSRIIFFLSVVSTALPVPWPCRCRNLKESSPTLETQSSEHRSMLQLRTSEHRSMYSYVRLTSIDVHSYV